jgi:hypothetical protein
MEEQQKSWFRRNWPWVVPLGGCLTLIVLAIFSIGALFYGVSEVLTGSEPYEYAIQKANTNEHLIEAMGEPIESNGMMNGSLNYKNKNGTADFSIPIKGPKGEGALYVMGSKENDQWSYSKLYVLTTKVAEPINLLEDF